MYGPIVVVNSDWPRGVPFRRVSMRDWLAILTVSEPGRFRFTLVIEVYYYLRESTRPFPSIL